MTQLLIFSERFYGSFQRPFQLPAGTKAEQIDTQYPDGVLRIAVPKSGAAKADQIKIGEAKSCFWEKILGAKKEETKTPTQSQEKRFPEKVA